MNKLEQLQHMFHSQSSAFQRKLERSQRLIDEARKMQVKWYIAYSSGVDSLVVLHMLLSAGSMDVIWGDDGIDFPESLTFLVETEQRYGFSLQRIRCMQPWRDWCNEMARPDLCEDPAALGAWGNPRQWAGTWHSLSKDAPDHYTGVFLGLLASESRARGYVLKGGSKPLYQVQSEQGMWHCSPLAAWTKQDIWGYVAKNDLPYNPVYDKLAELRVPLERRRVAPLTCFRVLQYGSHGYVLRGGWPGLYNRLCAVFPKIRGYS